MAVAVLPALIMGVIDLPGSQPLQGIAEIRHQPILELDGGNGSCGPGNKDGDHARLQRRALQCPLHFICNVQHFAALRLKLQISGYSQIDQLLSVKKLFIASQ